MSTSIQARQPAGRPTGGQFATTEHGEADVALSAAAPRPAELDGWPDSLPAPELTMGVSDTGTLTTLVNTGYSTIEVWSEAPGETLSEWGGDTTVDDAVAEQAKAWAESAHQKWEAEALRQMKLAAASVFQRMRGGITGSQVALDDEELHRYATDSFSAGDGAVLEGERASVSLFARGVLAQYPDAHSVELSVMEHEAGSSFTAFTVFDEAGHQIGASERFEDDENEAIEEIWDVAHNLKPDSDTWADFAPSQAGSAGPSVDLHRAANWTPGARP